MSNRLHFLDSGLYTVEKIEEFEEIEEIHQNPKIEEMAVTLADVHSIFPTFLMSNRLHFLDSGYCIQ